MSRKVAVMPNGNSPPEIESTWHPARLIPVAGIRGQEEQERRAASAVLAVIRAVPDFGHALLVPAGAPRGRISTYAEVQLKDSDGHTSIPDGAVIVERGKTRWRALVEMKTGNAELTGEQVGRYLDMAREHGFNCVITISNQITARPTDLPFDVDRRRMRRVPVYHLSWWRIITEAVLEHRHRGVSDPDQAWILGELIAYLDHENSGASGFEDMGESWVRVRDGARQGTLRASDKEVRAVAERWEQFVDYLALGLSQDLGRDVVPLRPRGQTPEMRLDTLVDDLARGVLRAGLRVPDAAGALEMTANLQAQQVTTNVTVDAPREGRPTSRVNWLLRQLTEVPTDLRVETSFANTRETSAVLLGEAREYPQRLLSSSDPRREPRSFTLALTRRMGAGRGRSQGSFVRETRRQVFDFYGDIIQNLSAWRPRAPRLPEAPATVPEQPQPEPPPFVAADEREIGEGTTPLSQRT
jgi:hypothetical protein